MNNGDGKIIYFTDLVAWKEAHKLVLFIYKLTKDFPKEEMFGLVNQMRRCVVSITSNIAEGFSRNSYKEKTQFYCIALGSVTELQNQLMISRDVKYINTVTCNQVLEMCVIVHKLLNGLIKSSKKYS